MVQTLPCLETGNKTELLSNSSLNNEENNNNSYLCKRPGKVCAIIRITNRGFSASCATKGYLHFGHFEKIGMKDLLLHCAHTVFLVVFNCRTFASMGIITGRFLMF